MAEVVDLAPPRAGLTPSYRKIRSASRGFAILFFVLLVVMDGLAGLQLMVPFTDLGRYIYAGPESFYLSAQPVPGAVQFATLPFAHRMTYGLIGVVRTIPAILIFWSLHRLFRLYGQGRVFSRANAQAIKLVGVGLVLDAFAPFACHLVLRATGYEIDRNWLHLASLQALVLGAVVFVVAMVMQAGREIEEDREGFV